MPQRRNKNQIRKKEKPYPGTGVFTYDWALLVRNTRVARLGSQPSLAKIYVGTFCNVGF